MEPVPSTAAVLQHLAQTSDADLDLDRRLRELADQVGAVIPSCVGVSITILDEGLTFTLAASSAVAAALDAAQYASSGPCVDAARVQGQFTVDDVLDEDRWQQFALSAAAAHVRSSLSLPLMLHGEVTGAINLYAADPRAFAGHEPELRALLGDGVAHAVRNADLSFHSRDQAHQGPRVLAERDLIEQAVGYLMGTHRINADQARRRLHDAADRSGTDPLTTAHTLLSSER
ncbi:GAF and ANTAR domain-containing protein [Cellulomonas sp. 179-A 4D5 NHS]|uniref:GAF and ANTAR domain-containing protein n=1 Tax=Cellulomonas sp. 179-A 4D5 NHS TaxID=3142378 RepID=UPI00399F7174